MGLLRMGSYPPQLTGSSGFLIFDDDAEPAGAAAEVNAGAVATSAPLGGSLWESALRPGATRFTANGQLLRPAAGAPSGLGSAGEHGPLADASLLTQGVPGAGPNSCGRSGDARVASVSPFGAFNSLAWSEGSQEHGGLLSQGSCDIGNCLAGLDAGGDVFDQPASPAREVSTPQPAGPVPGGPQHHGAVVTTVPHLVAEPPAHSTDRALRSMQPTAPEATRASPFSAADKAHPAAPSSCGGAGLHPPAPMGLSSYRLGRYSADMTVHFPSLCAPPLPSGTAAHEASTGVASLATGPSVPSLPTGQHRASSSSLGSLDRGSGVAASPAAGVAGAGLRGQQAADAVQLDTGSSPHKEDGGVHELQLQGHGAAAGVAEAAAAPAAHAGLAGRKRRAAHAAALRAVDSEDEEEGGDRKRVKKGGSGKAPGRVRGGVTCRNCGAQQTPQWRCGPEGPRTLCNACGVRYKKGLPLAYLAGRS